MSGSVYIFLGPTLPVIEAERILQAEYLPPVSAGDICDLVLDREPPAVIGIVDGYFHTTPAVWHKEILYAMSRGTHVYGASSMGALRAAELQSFGMIGVGEIFEAFRDGRYTDDDEVAVAHSSGEDGYAPLSDPLVNLRAGVWSAVARECVTAASAEILITAAKSMFYADRSWSSMLQAGADRGVTTSEIDFLRIFASEARPNQKRSDAVTMLHQIRDELRGDREAQLSVLDFEATYYWEKLCRTVRSNRSARLLADVMGESVESAYQRLLADHPCLIREALLRYLAAQEADRLKLPTPAEGDMHGWTLQDAPLAEIERRYRSAMTAHLHELIVNPGNGPDGR